MGDTSDRPRMAILATVPLTIRAFYRQPLAALAEAGIDVTVMCAGRAGDVAPLPPGVRFHPMDFTRTTNPLRDLRAVWRLFCVLRRERFDLVQYSTPKAALLGTLAARAARVPVRIYLMWGLYYEGQQGWRRKIWIWFEKLLCFLNTHVVMNSLENLEVVVRSGIVPRAKSAVIRHGSPCGVDLSEFDAARWAHCRPALRQQLNIPAESVVIGLFGRLTGDKGVNELVGAFVLLARRHPGLILLVVGPRDEEKDRPQPETLATLSSHPQIRNLGWQDVLLPCFATIDIFCLPSYREGLPQAVLEAQAMCLPVVCTDIMGCRDAAVHGETAFLVAPRSTTALLEPLERLITDPDLRATMGRNGRRRIEALFDARDVVREMVAHRLGLLAEARKHRR
ncbi:MAG: glycosyltransferase family 4 protein [Phycisphaerae bacterium]|nr:glycosyltransferase family 4 protein [Phycisphaerae bacterium]